MNERMETSDTIKNYFYVYKLDTDARLRHVQCKIPINSIFLLSFSMIFIFLRPWRSFSLKTMYNFILFLFGSKM